MLNNTNRRRIKCVWINYQFFQSFRHLLKFQVGFLLIFHCLYFLACFLMRIFGLLLLNYFFTIQKYNFG